MGRNILAYVFLAAFAYAVIAASAVPACAGSIWRFDNGFEDFGGADEAGYRIPGGIALLYDEPGGSLEGIRFAESFDLLLAYEDGSGTWGYFREAEPVISALRLGFTAYGGYWIRLDEDGTGLAEAQLLLPAAGRSAMGCAFAAAVSLAGAARLRHRRDQAS